jgi:hypothetical protein
MRSNHRDACCLLVLLVLLALPAAAEEEADKIAEALTKGNTALDVRYRLETVDQDGFDEDAVANTLRVRLDYETLKYHGFFAGVGLEGNIALGAEDYNSTANGKVDFPVVPDPEDAEINEGYLGYTGLGQTTFKLGRQVINLDNQRFVGAVAWRQLEQTFDAFRAGGKFGKRYNWFYSNVNTAIRVFGEHNPNPDLAKTRMSTDLANFSIDLKAGKLVAYGYWMEFKNNPGSSQKSFGLRFTGKRQVSDGVKLLYSAEYADQSSYKDGGPNVDAKYYFGELGAGFKPVTVKLGYEVLGGDGDYGFLTPLATLHKFNGWADKFLVTPTDGLQDLYVVVSGTVAKVKLAAVYHDFSADNGNANYGDEWDLLATRSFGKLYSVLLKYASYSADTHATDTDKFWLQLGLRFK